MTNPSVEGPRHPPLRVTVLGCGGSGGVPLSNGDWGECDPADPRNRRLRVSILVESPTTRILVDTSPDLRLQLLAAGVESLDAILFTHAHADHCHGIDDLRSLTFTRGSPIPGWLDPETRAQLTQRFDYAFASAAPPNRLYFPLIEDRVIEGPMTIGDIAVTPFVQAHGPVSSLGFRFGDFAYSTDVSELDERAFEVLAGIRVWIVDALRARPHPSHAHFERTFGWIARLAPERAVLTHLNHSVDYATLRGICPPGVEPAFDGMVLEIDHDP